MNTTFTLSSPPIASADVRVVINGVELSNGKDFKVDGQLITMAIGAAPGKESAFQVAYQTQFPAATHDSSSCQGTNSVDGIVRASLFHALDGENMTANSRLSSQQPQSHTTSIAAQPHSRGSDSRALSLLSQRLEEGANGSRPSLKTLKRADVQGPEGLGDQNATTPYSMLFGSHIRRLLGAEPLASDRGLTGSAQQRSLIMLEQRLYGIDPSRSTKSRK